MNGAVRVVQPEQGYRAGLDALMLAASLSAGSGQHLLEAGTGSGAALFCAAHRLPGVSFTGVDSDKEALERAARGCDLNGFGERVQFVCADISERLPEWEGRFDGAFANPPYLEPGKTRICKPERKKAILATTPLIFWVRFLLHGVRRGGSVTLIHRAAALPLILDLLCSRAGQIEILPIHPAPFQPARRVLVRARKGLRSGDIVLHDGIALYCEPGGESGLQLRAVESGQALKWGLGVGAGL